MDKKTFKDNFTLLNKHIERHNLLMIIATSILALIGLFLVIYWNYDNNDINDVIDYLYLGGNYFFLGISVLLTGFLILSRFKKFKTNILAILIHIFVFLLISWGTLICILDLRYGFSPLLYLIIYLIIAGLFVVEPLFFFITISASISAILTLSLTNNAAFFSGANGVENLTMFIIYIVVVILVAGEHFGITINDYKNEKQLETLTYYDDLTGLLNERSYLKDIESIDKAVKEKQLSEYAIVLMDLNNIKATNDQYGHRFGCHLIVRCGKTLPTYFKTSNLYHIGGDEFVTIVLGEDYKNLDQILDNIEKDLVFSHIEFEGTKLIFSVAQGVSKYQEGFKYKDVLQKADDEMYKNKELIKSKYGLKRR